jgi:RNA 3'-terminal phosphate cyclase
MRKINELGYTVTNTNKEAGFITAEKQTSGLGTALLTGRKYQDQLTVAIFDDTATNGRKLRVTAAQATENALAFGNASKTGVAPSNSGKADAQAVLSACSEGSAASQQTAMLFMVDAFVAE